MIVGPMMAIYISRSIVNRESVAAMSSAEEEIVWCINCHSYYGNPLCPICIDDAVKEQK